MLDDQSHQKKCFHRLPKSAGQQRACAALFFGKYVSDSDENVNHINHLVSKRTSFGKPCFGIKPQFSISQQNSPKKCFQIIRDTEDSMHKEGLKKENTSLG